MAAELGLSPKIAVIEGDDLRGQADALQARHLHDMFNGRPLPEGAKIASINAYFGAFPIASALDAGADIVITGRVVDSALSLGALIHEFGWTAADHDRLAAGTLVGHLLECSSQVTGGIFTDWASVPRWEDMGKPIAEVREDGTIVVTKPEGSGWPRLGRHRCRADDLRGWRSAGLCRSGCGVRFQPGRAQPDRPDRVEITGVKGYPPPPSTRSARSMTRAGAAGSSCRSSASPRSPRHVSSRRRCSTGPTAAARPQRQAAQRRRSRGDRRRDQLWGTIPAEALARDRRDDHGRS